MINKELFYVVYSSENIQIFIILLLLKYKSNI